MDNIKLKGSNSNSYVNIDRKMIKWNTVPYIIFISVDNIRFGF